MLNMSHTSISSEKKLNPGYNTTGETLSTVTDAQNEHIQHHVLILLP